MAEADTVILLVDGQAGLQVRWEGGREGGAGGRGAGGPERRQVGCGLDGSSGWVAQAGRLAQRGGLRGGADGEYAEGAGEERPRLGCAEGTLHCGVRRAVK